MMHIFNCLKFLLLCLVCNFAHASEYNTKTSTQTKQAQKAKTANKNMISGNVQNEPQLHEYRKIGNVISRAREFKSKTPIKNRKKLTDWQDQSLAAISERFIRNESIMLFTKPDDVVLGKVSSKAKIELLNMDSFITSFWQTYDEALKMPNKHAVLKFVKIDHPKRAKKSSTLKYAAQNRKLFANLHLNHSKKTIVANMKKAILTGNVDSVRAYLDNYGFLNNYCSKSGWVSYAMTASQYNVAKFLIHRGL